MNKIWTDVERQFIRNNASEMTDEVIARKLSLTSNRNITIQAVRKQRQKMKIKKECGRGICRVVGQKKESPSLHIARSVMTTQPVVWS